MRALVSSPVVRPVLLGGLFLAACASEPTPAPPVGSDPGASSERPAASSGQIPNALLGTYDVDADACGQEMTTSRLDVRPDTLRFYYGYAAVASVDAEADGYRVGATLYQLEGVEEVVPEEQTYRLAATDGGLRLSSDYGGDARLVRCGTAGPTPPSGSAGVESAYTEITGCETIREADVEAGTTTQRCPGYGGVPLYVSEGDLRYDVDAGVQNDRWTTPGGFNGLGKTVEWRIRDGRPFAVIVRYEVEGPGGTAAERRSDLAVIKVGREGAPGCLVSYVGADARPSQNEAARALADREAAGHDCSADRS